MMQNYEEYVKSLQSRCFLTGYISRDIVIQKVNGLEFQITAYQGEHSDEYMVSEMKNGEVNGRVQLFRKGVLQMSWRMDKGCRVDGMKIYEDGKMSRLIPMSFFLEKQYRVIESTVHGAELVITNPSNGVILYRGKYNSVMEREGRGWEYDSDNGRVLVYGEYVKDELVHMIQEFESEDRMIEYGDSEENNIDVMNRRPVYVGGYVFDDEECMYVRNGSGVEMDSESGLGCGYGEWINGHKERGRRLSGGWFVRNDLVEDSMRVELNEVVKKKKKKKKMVVEVRRKIGLGLGLGLGHRGVEVRKEVNSESELKSIPMNVSDLVVGDDCCNNESIVEVDLRQFSCLRNIKVGSGSFVNVKTIDVSGLSLREVYIGSGSFMNVVEVRPESKMVVSSKRDLIELSGFVLNLEIASNSCNESELIEVDLRGFSVLRSLVIGSNSLASVLRVDMSGLKLNRMKIGEGALMNVEEVMMENNEVIECRFVVKSECDLNQIPLMTSEIVFAEDSCNDASIEEIDVRCLKNLRRVEIGANSLMNVIRFEANWRSVKIIGRSVMIKSVNDIASVSRLMTSLTIGCGSCNDVGLIELILKDYPLLQSMDVGNESCANVCGFVIDGLNELKRIRIGMNSFTLSKVNQPKEERKGREFHLRDCCSLESLDIGCCSFSDYSVFDLYGLDSLKSIKIGDIIDSYCFNYVGVVDLINLPSLETIELGKFSFQYCQSVRFENLPSLKAIVLNDSAVCGDNRNNRHSLSRTPYFYKNSLSMKNLPSLALFVLGKSHDGFSRSLCNIGSVILENICKLKMINIRNEAIFVFQFVTSLQSNNADGVEQFIRSKTSWLKQMMNE